MHVCSLALIHLLFAFPYKLLVHTSGLADYYVRVTWPWVKYFGNSKIAPHHHVYPLQLKIVGENPEPLPITPTPPETYRSWLIRVDKLKDAFKYEEQDYPVKILL